MSKRRFAIFSAWLLALCICLAVALNTPVATDLSLFIPETDDAAKLINELRAGHATRLIMIGLEGGSEQDKAMSSRRLAEQLRNTQWFARVANGMETIDREEQRRLFSWRYLLSSGVSEQRFHPAALREALQQRLQELSSPISALIKQLLPSDPTGEFRALLQTWQTDVQVDKRHGVWFSADGKRSLLLLETHAAGFDLDAQTKAIAAIHQAFATAKQSPDMELLLTGPAVFATLSRDTIRIETQILSLAACAVVMLILWFSYRSPRLLLLSILPLGSGILIAMATVGVLFGEIHGITLAFGVTLLGVAIDYPIHCFSHLCARESVTDSLLRIWPTLRLGVITTALGYLAMISTSFTGLAQLGLFAISGLLSAAACTRWLLPMFLPLTWAPGRDVAVGAWLQLHPSRSLALLSAVIGMLVLLALIIISPPLWEDDLAVLSPVPASAITLDRELRTALGAPEAGHMIVITAADAETALQRSEAAAIHLERLIEQNVLSGFQSAAAYLPSQKTQRLRQSALPGPALLQQALHTALVDLPFKPGLFDPFLTAVESARTEPLLSPQDLLGTALGLRLSALLFQNNHSWITLLPLVGVNHPARVAAAFDELALTHTSYLNLKQATDQLVADFRDATLVRLSWGALLITLALWLGLKSLRRVLAVLLPVLLAIVMDVAVLLCLGERLSLFHLVSLLLILGIGLDYSLFFSRSGDDPAVRRRTFHALLVCSGSTLAVFGMLALSALPVLKFIGQTVAIGVLTSFCMALTLARVIARP